MSRADLTRDDRIPIRPGMTVPLAGHLRTHREQLIELADLGYTDVWSAESDTGDGFTPLTLAAAWEPRLRLGTAIIACVHPRPGADGTVGAASMANAAARPVRPRHRVVVAT